MKDPRPTPGVFSFPEFLIAILIFVLTFVVFSGALDHKFVNWDDDLYVNSPIVRSLDAEHLGRMLTSREPFYWHPLTWMSHALDISLYGKDPAGHHLSSLVWHSLNAVLVFLLFLIWVPRVVSVKSRSTLLMAAAWTSLVFAVHPLRVESAAWIAERKDLLCAFFMMAAMAIYPRTLPGSDRRNLWRGVTLLAGALALMSKPMAVTLPVLLFLLDGWPLKRFRNISEAGGCLLEKWPFFLMSLGSGLLTLVSQKNVGAMIDVADLSLMERGLNALTSLFFYLEKTLWPGALVPLYPYPTAISLFQPRYLSAALGMGLVLVFGVVQWRKGCRGWLTLWLWYLVAAAPVIGLVQVGRQGAADRFTYLPTLVFYLAAGALVLKLLENGRAFKWKGSQRGAALLIWGIVPLLGLGTIQQVKVWHDAGSMWKRVVEVYPARFSVAWEELGTHAWSSGRPEEARDHFQAALKIDPDAYPIRNNLGLVLVQLGDEDRARKEFDRALQQDPGPTTFNNLGLLFFNRKEFSSARHYFEKALLRDPEFPQALNNLGLLHRQDKDWMKALELFKKAASLDEGFWEARANLGVVYLNLNRLPEALGEISAALEYNPLHKGLLSLQAQIKKSLSGQK